MMRAAKIASERPVEYFVGAAMEVKFPSAPSATVALLFFQ
jgi:hypothetical protein